MLFEPSGELHCDYGAYCHALGLTEREELYRSIFTNEEERREKEAKYLRDQSPLITSQSVGSGVTDSPLQQVIAAAAGVSFPFPAATVTTTTTTTAAAAAPTATTTPPKRSASTASGRSRKKEVAVDDSPKGTPQTVPPAITFIVMRNLKFCLNERDMKPLALAIPHCHSLVSVEFVGCGLSMESYFLLVESLYKSRRVASVIIDFNSIHHPGFFEDPTIPAKTQSETPNGTVDGKTAMDLSLGTAGEETTTLSAEVSAALSGDVRKSIIQVKDSSIRISDDPVPLKLRKSVLMGGVKFAPSAYRGLNGVLSALEYQIRDERDRKGKVDSKKQAQQQQHDQIAQIDKESPIFVPRGWPAMLLTGVKHLSLRGNGIADDDVITMASLLARHPRSELISLNLWGNRITDAGATALACMLKENRTLQVLDLGHNNIGDVGLLQLVDCFRMQDIPMEKLISYRKRQLMRLDATLREQQLASTVPPAYPSYQELYNAWYQNKFPAVVEEKKDSKKASQAKAKKTETVLVRPTTPFDRDCFRMENTVRVPGNTVLRCVNLGNNQNITVGGAREALRILALREPSDDGEMSALQNSSTHPPELYCASITLRSFVILHSGDSELRKVQKTLSDVLHERQLLLSQPAPEDEVVVEDAKKKSPRNRK
ncbi:Leucine-rich repeat [Trypanosoma melophagium]|uniref:Leucine-rich repeat n=1 Tax=Trypanosoma melophagium TaxID=715481 RepID=UPI00351A3E22|nr:Leucine-rich repeat [Trypanosoma melophagium]